MNYTKKSVTAKQKALNSKSVKWGRKLALTLLKVFLIAFIGVGILGLSAGVGMFKGILASTPQITSNDVAPIGAATFVYDSEGNLIDELVASNSNRIMVNKENITKYLGLAFVALEDERFYEHNGIDFKGLIRAAYQFVITGGDEAQGASTITQQLLKNTIFTDWTSEGDNTIKKIKRKLQEQYLAIELTKILDHDEILVRYMNTINLGQNTLGVEAASQRYFGKSSGELSISECATLAAITQNPSRYNPIKYPEYNATRRKVCLDNMLKLEFITKAEYDEAISDDVYARIENHNINYLANDTTSSYFVDALTYDVKADLIAAGYNETQAEFLLNSGGLRIHSTMNPTIQAIVDKAVANPDNYPTKVNWQLSYALTIINSEGERTNYSQEMMTKYFQENHNKNFDLIFASQEEAYEAIETFKESLLQEGSEVEESITLTIQPQISVVILDQTTGHIVALSGGRGEKEGRLTLNRATDTVRQPGSTFKVLSAFAPALDSAGMTLATVFNDAPFNYDDGTPVNNWYTTGYRGLNSIRTAVKNSMNIISVKTLTQITPQLGYDYLLNFGFTTLTTGMTINNQVFSDIRQPLALGGITRGVTNEELTAAYATIANGGVYIKPKLYTQVFDSDGRLILDNSEPDSHRVIKETTAFLLTDAMIDVVTSGTGSSVRFDNSMAIAGKTGTTSSNVDVWFSGYTPYYTCSTWTGYDNNTKMSSSSSNNEIAIAKTLWRAVMSEVHEDLPSQQFSLPSGIVRHSVCSRSGKLPIPGLCDGHLITEYFAEDTIPTESCDVHYEGPVCSYDGYPASAECPFPHHGICELLPIEDISLQSGSTIPVTQPDGSVIYQTPRTANTCQHDANFFANPGYENILIQQQQELDQRNAAAAAAAQAAAQAAQNGESIE